MSHLRASSFDSLEQDLLSLLAVVLDGPEGVVEGVGGVAEGDELDVGVVAADARLADHGVDGPPAKNRNVRSQIIDKQAIFHSLKIPRNKPFLVNNYR